VLQSLIAPSNKNATFDLFLKTSPHLTSAQVAKKIALSNDPFHLYRSFVPLYYDELNRDLQMLPSLKAIRNHVGWIFGDPHPENFGIVLNTEEKAVFTMNDLDDFARGPLIDDVIRMVASVNLYDKRFDANELLNAYRKGLVDGDLPDSKLIKKMIRKAESKGMVPPKKVFDHNTKRIIRADNTAEVTEPLRMKLTNTLMDFYGKHINVSDVVVFKRDHGGSGGLRRYRALVKIDEQYVLIEFKQVIGASIRPFTDIKQPSIHESIQAGLKYTQGEHLSPLYGIKEVDGAIFMLRPRFDGNKGVSLLDLDADEVREVILYESRLLGKLHAKTADDAKAYIEAIKQVNNADIATESAHIADIFSGYFRDLKSGN
jgi:hypothetical protein